MFKINSEDFKDKAADVSKQPSWKNEQISWRVQNSLQGFLRNELQFFFLFFFGSQTHTPHYLHRSSPQWILYFFVHEL